jgi:hypothetical protein
LKKANVQITRVDSIQLFDLDLGSSDRLPDVREKLGSGTQSEAYTRYCDSFLWLFEPQTAPNEASSRSTDPTVAYLAEDVNCPLSLPGFDRFSLASDSTDPSDRGGVITISQSLKVAVVCIWRRGSLETDPLQLKRDLPVDIPENYLHQLSTLFPNIAEAELMYPFMAVRYDSVDLQAVLERDGILLGRLFSGGLDHEADATLKMYLKDNISIRRYEGLFLRPSDGVGIYTSGIEDSPEKDLRLYENTMFRAAQVCELCLLEHRLARSFKMRVDSDARKVRTFPRPFLVEKRRTELLALELGMVKSLPFRSPEAPALVRQAQKRFGILEAIQDAKDSYDFLEMRYQNTKTTALAIIAVLAYIFDKMHVWDAISRGTYSFVQVLLNSLTHQR